MAVLTSLGILSHVLKVTAANNCTCCSVAKSPNTARSTQGKSSHVLVTLFLGTLTFSWNVAKPLGLQAPRCEAV